MGTISTPSKTNGDQDIIEISSGDESEQKVTRENQKPTISKKRSLSAATVTGPPNKRQITTNVVEVLDSDDEPSKAVTTTVKILTMATRPTPLIPASNSNQQSWT